MRFELVPARIRVARLRMRSTPEFMKSFGPLYAGFYKLVLVGKKQIGTRPVGLGDDPDLARPDRVGAQDAPSVGNAEGFSCVFGRHVTSITGDMPVQELQHTHPSVREEHERPPGVLRFPREKSEVSIVLSSARPDATACGGASPPTLAL